jgi:hypothetical protein
MHDVVAREVLHILKIQNGRARLTDGNFVKAGISKRKVKGSTTSPKSPDFGLRFMWSPESPDAFQTVAKQEQ